MIDKSTVKLLRIPFSYFLMPVFLFTVTVSEQVSPVKLALVFIILHLFVYPASNGYNSYIDRDETPIGGLEKPPLPGKQLFWVTLFLDIAGLLLAIFVGLDFLGWLLCYILASRAYSSPQIRLKKRPVIGFLTVMIFQGAITFIFVFIGIGESGLAAATAHWPAIVGASFLIAGVYPLTQIYQHDADKENGDITLSVKLGYRGTFIFSLLMFMVAGLAIFKEYSDGDLQLFYVFIVFLLPVIVYFNYWMMAVWKNTGNANYKNTMRMNMIAATCMNLAFIINIITKHLL